MSRSSRPIHRFAPVVTLAALGLAAVAVPAAGARPPQTDGPGRISLEQVGRYVSDAPFDTSAAEIVAHDPLHQRVFVVNAQAGEVDVLDVSDPTSPDKMRAIAADGAINSVAVHDGLVAVAVQADLVQDRGTVELYDADLVQIGGPISVGSLPDMVTFTPDGTRIVVANEGEPDNYCDGDAGDPEGSVSIIDVSDPTSPVVETADFNAFDDHIDDLRAAGVRIFGPDASVSQDLEPEYVTIDADSTTAWVSLQENNAFAIVDLASATVTDIVPLGDKDHSVRGNGIDASNRDDAVNIRTWPVLGMYQPDAIDSYEFGNRTYVVSANEGDARDYDCYSEEERIKGLDLDPVAFPDAEELQEDGNLGRLKTTTSFLDPDPESDSGFAPAGTLYSYGARSVSIWDESGALVWDSGDQIEQITARLLPDAFNSNNDDNDSFDARSDDKGPEPEAVVVGKAYGKTYAFLGLERVGGIMVFDITTPRNPRYVTYVNNRDFTEAAEDDGTTNPAAGDLGPEGLAFVTASDSPNGVPLLVVGNEVSGSTTVYEIRGPGKPR